MNNLADQLRHSLICHLPDEQVMEKVKTAIEEELKEKQEEQYEPSISWERFLKTKMVNKTYL